MYGGNVSYGSVGGIRADEILGGISSSPPASVADIELPDLVLSHPSHVDEAVAAVLHTLLFLRERRAVRPVETDCVKLAPLTFARWVESIYSHSISPSMHDDLI
jgi:GTPase